MPSFKKFLGNSKLKLIDIGASGGIHPRFKSIIDNLICILFEPDNRSYNKLIRNPLYKVYNYAVGDKDENVILNLAKKKECSSLYKPNLDF